MDSKCGKSKENPGIVHLLDQLQRLPARASDFPNGLEYNKGYTKTKCNTTQNGARGENRYTKFLDRFKECYDRLPEAAAKELDSLMSDYGIRFSPDESILNGEVIDNV